ncbi:MAG: MFS transporter [Bacteroides sp.]|nr:MFS transporter [Bacteroides sp.]
MNSSLILLSITNFLLYASMYMLLPVLPVWMQQEWMCNYTEIGSAIALFGVGLFLPGMFNSYLIDRFKRKNICSLSLLGLLALTYLYPLSGSATVLSLLRLLQGMLFGTATMTLGSTLVIDVTPSHRRTKANVMYAWVGRMGMISGVAAGVFLYTGGNICPVIYISMACGLIGWAVMEMVKVAFRAPLEPSLVSLDRFLLPRAFYPAAFMLPVAALFGIFIARICTASFYLFMAAGMGLAAWVVYSLLCKRTGRIVMELGIVSGVGGLLMLMFSAGVATYAGAAVCLGLGIALCGACFYDMLIRVPLHCERGTGNNTYQLFWELGVMAGIFIESVTDEGGTEIFAISLCLCALVLSIYELSLHKWYDKQLKNNH